ncbi:MAG: hypothetical protein ABSA86_13420 [Oryzomonas sp.]|jgi:hypothetical protein
MADESYTVTGRALDEAELEKFPAESRVKVRASERLKEIAATKLIQDKSAFILNRMSYMAKPSTTWMCPVGPHKDPGLGMAVGRACNISPVKSVAVQCSQGHWAEYKCKGGQ